jgi:hypothetical protein
VKRYAAALLGAALCAVPLDADVRVTSTTTIDGPFAAMTGGMTPRIVMHIKGNRARADLDMGPTSVSTITDIAGLVTILNPAQKTAQVIDPAALAAGLAGKEFAMPKLDASITPTGKVQAIGGTQCEEHTLVIAISMAEFAGSSSVPPEAAAMMKDVRMIMNGTMWIAKSGPGVAEYVAFQTAAAKAGVAKFMSALPGMQSSGMDRVMNAFSAANGLPYLTEMTMAFEGSGPIVEMMNKQGTIKITTKVREVSTAPISDDLFKVPDDYTVVKQE